MVADTIPMYAKSAIAENAVIEGGFAMAKAIEPLTTKDVDAIAETKKATAAMLPAYKAIFQKNKAAAAAAVGCEGCDVDEGDEEDDA